MLRRILLLGALVLAPTVALADPVQVVIIPSGAVSGSPTDKGGTITNGGTAQPSIAANQYRKLAFCQNPASATEDLYVAVAGDATVDNSGNLYDLAPGAGNFIPGTGVVSVNATSTSHRYLCTEWQ